jgi:hypothetical protein
MHRCPYVRFGARISHVYRTFTANIPFGYIYRHLNMVIQLATTRDYSQGHLRISPRDSSWCRDGRRTQGGELR